MQSRKHIANIVHNLLAYRGDANNRSVAAQKIILQQRFKDEFGIKLWKPKPGGGTYMDGRCAKLAFGNPEKFSQIIGNVVQGLPKFRLLLGLAWAYY